MPQQHALAGSGLAPCTCVCVCVSDRAAPLRFCFTQADARFTADRSQTDGETDAPPDPGPRHQNHRPPDPVMRLTLHYSMRIPLVRFGQASVHRPRLSRHTVPFLARGTRVRELPANPMDASGCHQGLKRTHAKFGSGTVCTYVLTVS